MFSKLIRTNNQLATILIRLMVGAVSSFQGIQKLLIADKSGAGRFEKIGLPNQGFLGPFVGVFEIACSFFILIGCLTPLSAFPLTIIMPVAIASTKAQLLFHNGFWSMLLGGIFFIVKGGKWSMDTLIMEAPGK